MTFERELAERLRGAVALVGIGNPMRGDDAAGTLVARRLLGRCGAAIIDAEECPELHLGPILESRPEVILLVDAVDLGARPGSVALLRGDQLARYAPTTHRLPLGLLAEYLGRRSGAAILLLAIQPARLEWGAEPSREVEASVALVATAIGRLIPQRAARAEGRPAMRDGEVAPC